LIFDTNPQRGFSMFDFTPPARPYDAYIFDCDGTLANSMPLHLAAWNHGLEMAGAPFRIDGKSFMSVAGMSTIQTIAHWNQTHACQIDLQIILRVKDDFFHANMHTIQPIEPVVAFARACAARGAKVSVASGGTADGVRRTLEIIGLGDLFPVVVTADDVTVAKPAPDIFLLAAERMGVPPVSCLVLEDSPLGITAANAAGMDSILLPASV
jgi:HAD superfamily hydrolase (TIGR01509 family)